MTIITTKQLRSRMAEFIEILKSGQEVQLEYRSTKILINGRSIAKTAKSGLRKAVSRLSKYKINSKYKKAKSYREIKQNYYE